MIITKRCKIFIMHLLLLGLLINTGFPHPDITSLYNQGLRALKP